MRASLRAPKSHWSSLPFIALLSVSATMYSCADDEDGDGPGASGMGGSRAGAGGGGVAGGGRGGQSGGGAGGAPTSVDGAGAGGEFGSGAEQGDGGATQGAGGTPPTDGGAPQQSDGGAAQADGGATLSEGGATQTAAGAPAAGSAGAPSEPCEGEVIDGECVALAPFMRVQTGSRTAGTGVASDVVRLSADTAVGNLLLLSVGVVWSGAVQTITVPSAFVLVEQRNNTTGTSQHESAALYVAENAAVLPAASGVTVSVGAGDARVYLVLAEYAGLQAIGALDQKASQAGGATPSPGTTAPTTADNELWVVASVSRGGGGHSAPTDDFAIVQALATGAGSFSLLERVVTERGPATASIAASGDYASVIATFRRGREGGS